MSENKEALLGYATTRELIEELTARIDVGGMLDYSTVNGVTVPSNGEVRAVRQPVRFGMRVEDGGVMGTIVRCHECGGEGELHKPDVMPEPSTPDVE